MESLNKSEIVGSVRLHGRMFTIREVQKSTRLDFNKSAQFVKSVLEDAPGEDDVEEPEGYTVEPILGS